MRQKVGRDMPQRLLIGLIVLAGASSVHAQVQHIDFQVIHLPRQQRLPDAQYVAIRTPGAWNTLWPANSKDPIARPIPKIDLKHFILLIADTGVKRSSGYSSIFLSVDCLPSAVSGPVPSKRDVTTVHILELAPGNCPRLAALMGSVSYALIPRTTNEIRFVVTKADSNCASPINPPFVK
jgi:hypothetical protein